MDIQQKNKKQTNSYWSCSQPNWRQVQFDTGTQPHRFDMKVTTTLALPVYLILSAGANRSQTIDLIKENNGWPHQVSLIENKHKKKNYILCSLEQITFKQTELSVLKWQNFIFSKKWYKNEYNFIVLQ